MASIDKQLARARREARLVRVQRRKGWTAHDGYIVAVAKRWTAIRVVDDGVPDGLVIVRTQDIRKLGKPDSNRKLARAALTRLDSWPPLTTELIDLRDTRSVLFTAGSCHIVGYATEKLRARVFFAGYVLSVTKRKVWFGGVTPKGRHTRGQTGERLRDITRVDINSRYLKTLAKVAG